MTKRSPASRCDADRLGRLLAELFELARIDVEFAHFALGVALQALVEGDVPAVAEAQHLQHAVLGKVAADLLRHADAHVLDDLLGAAHMRRDLGDRLDDQMQVADRDALGEQQLQHRLQAGIGDVRGADLVGELAVFGILPLEQRLHVLVGKQLRQVVADHFAEMREQHRHVVGEGEVVALQILANISGTE